MREPVDAARLRAFMRALGEAAREPLQVYLAGGGTAVLEGWRSSTIDVDLKLVGDADAVLRAIPALKERLSIKVELASPDDFIPVKPGWEDRRPFIAKRAARRSGTSSSPPRRWRRSIGATRPIAGTSPSCWRVVWSPLTACASISRPLKGTCTGFPQLIRRRSGARSRRRFAGRSDPPPER